MRTNLIRLLAAMLVLASIGPVQADEAPRRDAPQPNAADEVAAAKEGETTVRDVLVLRGSQFETVLSDRTGFESAMPRSVAGRRKAETASPTAGFGGLLTFGGATQPSFDLLLEYPNGERVMSYPVGQPRSERELWQGVSLTDERGRATAIRIDADHWLGRVRESDRRWLTIGRRAEQALLYDVTLRGTVDLRLRETDGDWSIANGGRDPVDRVLVAVPDGERWRTARLDRLGSGLPDRERKANELEDAESDGDAAGDAEKKKSEATVGKAIGSFVAAALGKKPAADERKESNDKAEAAADLEFVPLSLDATDTAEGLAASYAASLDGLDDLEREFVADAIRRGLGDRAVVVYSLPPEQHERLIALEITPRIGPIVRHAVVVAVDLDPGLEQTIRDHVAALGDDSWRRRVAAEESLRRLGMAAKRYLEEAKESDDAEVGMRASRLLDALDGPKGT